MAVHRRHGVLMLTKGKVKRLRVKLTVHRFWVAAHYIIISAGPHNIPTAEVEELGASLIYNSPKY